MAYILVVLCTKNKSNLHTFMFNGVNNIMGHLGVHHTTMTPSQRSDYNYQLNRYNKRGGTHLNNSMKYAKTDLRDML